MRKTTTTEETGASLGSLAREHGENLPATTAAGFSGESTEKLPAHVTAERSHGALRVSVRRTNGAQRWVSLGLAVVLTAVVTYSWATGAPFVVWSALLPFFLYSAAKDFLNKTVLTVDQRKIVVTRGPVRIRGREEILPSDQLHYLFVQRVAKGHGSNQTTSFTLIAEMHDRRSIELVTDLDDAHQGQVIKDQIEGELGFRDRA